MSAMRKNLAALTVAAVLLPAMAAAQTVDILGVDPDPATLAEALTLAPAGAEIVVTGTHVGHFTIDRPLTLRGGDGAVLDGGGRGTVLTILADDVTVEGLTLTGSGLSDDFWQAWGPAGLRVEGDRAQLAGLDVTGNGWGVLFRGGEESALRDSRVADNQRDGVMLMGGARHEIARNTIDGNRTGVIVDALYGDSDRVLLPLIHDPAWNQEVAALQAASVPAVAHRIVDNRLTGNGATGILLHYHVRETRVARNRVSLTGIGREPDPAESAFWEEVLGAPIYTPTQTEGSGIMLFCWPERNAVVGNHVHDNRAIGIGIEAADLNQIRRNLIENNAVGIEVSGSDRNVLSGNVVTGNRDFGIHVDGWLWLGQGRSDQNLIHLNDLAGNGVNAFDGSGRILTAAEIAAQFPLAPWPAEMRAAYDNPVVVAQMAATLAAQQAATANRWDDGSHGNRHDDFDAPDEGFVDRDGDGIGEARLSIPDGGATDNLPLTTEALAATLAGE